MGCLPQPPSLKARGSMQKRKWDFKRQRMTPRDWGGSWSSDSEVCCLACDGQGSPTEETRPGSIISHAYVQLTSLVVQLHHHHGNCLSHGSTHPPWEPLGSISGHGGLQSYCLIRAVSEHRPQGQPRVKYGGVLPLVLVEGTESHLNT